jgi:transcriptional regulator with XRE-family HTH domain
MIDLQLWKAKKKELNLSLQDIAQQTEVSISTIKDIFRGATTDPRIETVQRIETVLGLNEKTPPVRELTDDEKELFELITQLTENEIDELSNFVDFLLSSISLKAELLLRYMLVLIMELRAIHPYIDYND